MSKSIRPSDTPLKTSEPVLPTKEKPTPRKSEPPRMRSKPLNESPVKSVKQRGREGLKLDREYESDEDKGSEILPDKAQKLSSNKKEIHRRQKNTQPSPQSTQKEKRIEIPTDETSADHQMRLTKAIETGDVATVKQLIKQNPDIVSEVERSGAAPLLRAISDGHDAIAKELITANANLDKKKFYTDENALMLAIDRGFTDLTKILINKGANICSTDRSDRSALDYAIIKGDLETVKFLNDQSAHLDLGNRYYRSAFLHAVTHNHLGFAKIVAKKIEPLELNDISISDVLVEVIDRNDAEAVKMILDNLTIKNSNPDIARMIMEIAFRHAKKLSDPKITNLLIEYGVRSDILSLDLLAKEACQTIKMQLAGEANEEHWKNFQLTISKKFRLEEAGDIVFQAVKNYALAYGTTSQDYASISDQQLKIIFYQSMVDSDGLHECAKQSFEKNNQLLLSEETPSSILAANLLIGRAQPEFDLQRQKFEQFIKNLNSLVKTRQLREAARDAGWHPQVIKLLTDTWTSLGRRRTKDNLFSVLRARLNTGEFPRRLDKLESDAARHLMIVQLDSLRRWIDDSNAS